MNTHSLLRVTGHMYLICAGSGMAGQRGPLQACGPGYQALPPPWYAIPTRKTCFSDITARTIWNIPLDHLHLMWRQVHNKAVQVFFCLSLTQGTHRQSPFSTVEQALFAFLISTFLSKQKKTALMQRVWTAGKRWLPITWHFQPGAVAPVLAAGWI